MQLGVSSYAFGWAVGLPGHAPENPFNELDLLAFARGQKLSVVQVGDHLPIHTYDLARLTRIRESASAGGEEIRIETGARGLTESHLQRYIDSSKILRARLLRFVIDGPGYEPAAKEIIALLRSAGSLLVEADLVLGIENHDRFPAKTLRSIIEAVGSERVGICLDTVNSLGAGEGLDQVLDQLGPHTVNLHIKDFAVSRVPSAMGFVVEGRPAGGGMLDVPAILNRLKSHRRCETAVLETWTTTGHTLADTIDRERRWAEESLAYLKPLFLSA
jgi:sugar phosphate isomerase/epimerase